MLQCNSQNRPLPPSPRCVSPTKYKALLLMTCMHSLSRARTKIWIRTLIQVLHPKCCRASWSCNPWTRCFEILAVKLVFWQERRIVRPSPRAFCCNLVETKLNLPCSGREGHTNAKSVIHPSHVFPVIYIHMHTFFDLTTYKMVITKGFPVFTFLPR